MSRLQVTRPVVGRQVVIELPEAWENVDAVDVTLTPHAKTPAELESGASALFQALEAVGFIGCIETDEQLSTSYKEKIDYANKSGRRD